MRIAFFADAKYIGSYEWMKFLAAQEGFEVHAIVFDGHQREIDGVTFHVLSDRFPQSKLRYFLCVPALKRLLKKIAPDLLIAYRIVSYGFSAALTGFHPLVQAAQGMFIASRAHTSMTRYFARKAVAGADLLHSWAPIMTANMVALGADPEKILTLTRGVNDRRYTMGAEPDGPLTLVTTRQLESYYNFPTLLEAIRLVRGEIGQLNYLIAGEGSLRGELEAQAHTMGLENSVKFLGSVNRDELPAILSASHLYIAAVPSDGTSSSMLEAMAAGAVPIVADNESNSHWIQDGISGRLLPPFNARAYASAIVQAWRDPAWRHRARGLNREVVESRASWEKNMATFVQTYKNLVNRAQPL
jgi:glycosyltransferase involved in cell wall biosynthesis